LISTPSLKERVCLCAEFSQLGAVADPEIGKGGAYLNRRGAATELSYDLKSGGKNVASEASENFFDSAY